MVMVINRVLSVLVDFFQLRLPLRASPSLPHEPPWPPDPSLPPRVPEPLAPSDPPYPPNTVADPVAPALSTAYALRLGPRSLRLFARFRPSRAALSRCYSRAWRRAGPRGSWTKEYRRRNRTSEWKLCSRRRRMDKRLDRTRGRRQDDQQDVLSPKERLQNGGRVGRTKRL